MKIHLIDKKEVSRKGGQTPTRGLCVYQAEPHDLWSGWFAQEAGWNGSGVVLAARVASREQAVAAWVAAHPSTVAVPSKPRLPGVSGTAR